jgi:hypothetical protein
MGLFSDNFRKKIDYHERRIDSRRYTKDQRDFSDGYTNAVYNIELHQKSDSASINARMMNDLAKNPKTPHDLRQQAKGYVAALWDFSKELPRDIDVWGRKRKIKRSYKK